ncbi:MAG TPA: cation:proton antiporter [Methylomirabilota bacterium]|nr:cation:proton antiporter [Methylomirabilota bacterium]
MIGGRRAGCRRSVWVTGAVLALLATGAAHAASGEGGHADPFAPILLELAVVVLAAAIGRRAAGLVGQPAVLGELVIGVIIGNVGYWLGAPLFVLLMHFDDVGKIVAMAWNSPVTVAEAATKVFPTTKLGPGTVGARVVEALGGPEGGQLAVMTLVIWLLSNLGVTLLLFMVGMESSVEELVGVGPRALVVAVVGIVAPFAAGFLTTSLLLPAAPTAVHLFVGATLSATSVGITARVFQDLRRLQSPEAKLILSAAVIDDVLGLIVLAVVAGVVATGGVHLGEVARISLLSAAFMAAVVFLGDRIARRLASGFRRLEPTQTRLLFALTLAFLMGWLANRIGLATIVGAFAAGLIVSDTHFPVREGAHGARDETVHALVAPLEQIFAPVFFLLMGMQVNLSTFSRPGTLAMAAALTAAAVAGKVVCGLAAGKTDRLSVGLGMVPRGEVGLIFASVGKGLGVIDDALFSAVVIMVMVTTMMTPITLKWSLSRAGG